MMNRVQKEEKRYQRTANWGLYCQYTIFGGIVKLVYDAPIWIKPNCSG